MKVGRKAHNHRKVVRETTALPLFHVQGEEHEKNQIKGAMRFV
jgi:hypothetical protein